MPPVEDPAGVTVHRQVTGRSRRAAALVARPTATDGAAYPVVAFGHGFLQRPWRYLSLLTRIAAHGVVVVAPDTQTGPLPRHQRLADDLWASVDWARSHVPGAHPVTAALVGHSMGSGAALLAATRRPGAATVVALAPVDTRPSCLPGLSHLRSPVLYVVGSHDSVVPPARSRDLYAATRSPATWAVVEGAGHCGVLDWPFPRGLGCGRPPLSPDLHRERVVSLVVDWLDRTCGSAAAGD